MFVVGVLAAEQALFDTPAAGRPTPASTLVLDGAEAARAPTITERARPKQPALELDPTDPGHLVLPLIKSDRNPFAQMLTVGRAKNNDLILASPQVSKVHAWLQQRGGTWHVRDKGSTNGTFVDCVRLDPGAECALVSGHTVRFAEVHGRFLSPADLLELCEAART